MPTGISTAAPPGGREWSAAVTPVALRRETFSAYAELERRRKAEARRTAEARRPAAASGRRMWLHGHRAR